MIRREREKDRMGKEENDRETPVGNDGWECWERLACRRARLRKREIGK